ncbi:MULTISPECIES: MFS transporter [unclassified Salinicola]|uniref:MFS transporter n=1 Tax=unclassified Salinicola TaxID=2634022 RepID=UPI001A8E9635|nr:MULTISPECIES: MFS transporter [unclassified Salinicola]MCE3026268.1 MFS transporter [Salinicola sp. DM10]WIX31478.1 MFS transporter [Salinicola sp. JS01]
MNAATNGRPDARVAILIELALAVGGFAIGTGEFAIMGLMPNVAQALGVGETQVGHLISAYALGVVVGAPLIAVFGAYLYRRHLLLLLMAFFAIGNFASALAPGYASLMLFRFISGLPHGAYFGVAALVAASMVPPHKRAKAVSRVMLGITTAMLIGNPLATWLGQLLSWRYAFGLVGAIGLVTVVLVFIYLPFNRDEVRNSPLRELTALRRRQVWLTLGIGAIGFAGMFCVFSYLAPTLIQVTGLEDHWVPVILAAFGVGAILGNMAGGWLFDRLQFRSVGWILGFSAIILLLFPLAAHSVWTVWLAVLAVGGMVALSPPLQIRLMDVAKDAQTLAAASNHAAFNVANALGPWLGGLAITAGYGWTSTGIVGAVMALGGLLIYALARWQEPRRASNEA